MIYGCRGWPGAIDTKYLGVLHVFYAYVKPSSVSLHPPDVREDKLFLQPPAQPVHHPRTLFLQNAHLRQREHGTAILGVPARRVWYRPFPETRVKSSSHPANFPLFPSGGSSLETRSGNYGLTRIRCVLLSLLFCVLFFGGCFFF